MKKATLVRLAAAAAVGLAGSAFAADTSRGAVPGVDMDVDANMKAPIADKNSDGKITKAEAASNPDLAREFTKLDTNKDGSLDNSEYAKFEAKAKGEGKVGNESGSEAKNPDVKGTTNDSTPGNKDLPGPGR